MSDQTAVKTPPDYKTHHDYVAQIGETAATARFHTERQWNRYYNFSYQAAVTRMLKGVSRRAVLDVGTSHGNWFNFLKRNGFQKIFGVELDAKRAELARKCGYDEVFNCDAAALPVPDLFFDTAISNDVFVHILQIEDKQAVLREIARVLKPGGHFIFNHTMALAHGYPNYFINQHTSFLSLQEFIDLATTDSIFEIVDAHPTYYHFRDRQPGILTRALRKFIAAPGAPELLHYLDAVHARQLSLENSDTVYLKLRKR